MADPHSPLPRLSVLDLVPVTEGATPRDALHRSRDLVRHAERLGYHRYWVAEHHNMTGIASAATSVVLGYLGEATTTIRLGAGGIMLPNHSPMVIAEQFGTLESLYPGRIDLGLGRAPGTDQLTTRALRRNHSSADDFPQDVLELQALLGPVTPGQAVQAVPGGGLEVPLWILGSSTYGAQLAAMLGLPYAFASHFAPDHLLDALRIYRTRFEAVGRLEAPHAMAAVNVFAADTDDEARRLFTSVQRAFTDVLRGTPGPFRPPLDDIDAYWSPPERDHVSRMLRHSVVGAPHTVRAGLEEFAALTGADELIVVSAIHDHAARVRSFEIVAEVAGQVGLGDPVGTGP
jgi:luciferase family oxidoreductase group 1